MHTESERPEGKLSGRPGLWILVLWAMLCALWNGYGAAQLAAGNSALGPTATYAGAGLALVLAALFVATSTRWPLVYKLLAAIAAMLGAITIWSALTLDPSNWPSEFWRWAGVAVNALAIVGAVKALFAADSSEPMKRGAK